MLVQDRLMKFVFISPGGCWNWIGYRLSHGYGRCGFRGSVWLAHRAFWTLVNGDIPSGMQVCHRCDNRSCVNPEHLFLGTQSDNMADMKRKGRGPKNYGELSGRAKLTKMHVLEIHRLYRLGQTHGEIAGRFGVKKPCIQKIVSGKRWPHVFKEVAEWPDDLWVREFPTVNTATT